MLKEMLYNLNSPNRWIFEDHLEPLVRQRREEREARRKKKIAEQGLQQRVLSIFGSRDATEPFSRTSCHEESLATKDDAKNGKVRANMIRRTNNALQRINPSGHVMDHHSSQKPLEAVDDSQAEELPVVLESPKSFTPGTLAHPTIGIGEATKDSSMGVYPTFPSSLRSERFGLPMTGGHPVRTAHRQSFPIAEDRETSPGLQRTPTVEFSFARQARGTSSEMEGVADSGGLSLVGSREENGARLSIAGDNTNQSHRSGEGLEHCKNIPLLV
jgi:hypothetical protein